MSVEFEIKKEQYPSLDFKSTKTSLDKKVVFITIEIRIN